VGIHDNYFALGGDSIMSIQIVARARQLGVQLTPRMLFQYQTIAELAAVAQPTNQPLATPELTQQPFPLTPVQHWFFEQHLPQPHYFNQSMLLVLRQSLPPALLQQALHHLPLLHPALRLRFHPC